MSVAAAVTAAASAAVLVIGIGRLAGSRPRVPRPPARAFQGPVARTGVGRRLGGRLARAGVPLGADAFVAAAVAAALLAAVLAHVALRLPLVTVAAAGAVGLAAASVVRSADRRHLDRVEAQLPGIAQQLAAGLGAGLSLRQALTRAARDAPEPARRELAQSVVELELGSRVEGALEAMAERVPAHDMRIMVTAILVQRRTGGNLARALAALADRLEERGRLARELRGATAQARMTAWMVAALPLAGGVVTEVAAPGTLAGTLGQGPGPLLLAVAAGLYAAGVLCIRRIGRVEP